MDSIKEDKITIFLAGAFVGSILEMIMWIILG